MAYRDDLEAAHARADAAERRVAELERELADLRGRREVALAPVVIPERMTLERAPRESAVTWRWRRTGDTEAALGSLALVGAWIAFMVGAQTLLPLLATPVAVALGYRALGRLVNRTTVRVSPGALTVTHAPLPWPGALRLDARDLRQAYVRRVQTNATGTTLGVRWEVRVIGRNERERLIAARLASDEAAFVVAEVEHVLGAAEGAVSDDLAYVTE